MRNVQNPKNRFEMHEVVWDDGEAPLATLHVHEEHAKSILSENKSPDIGFRFSVNPYRGCQHACAYCYARPSHAYWGFGAGTDFDREIIVKVNAPELLESAFAKASWQGETITFSGNTDCYQPLEGRYRLTRRLLEICLQHKNPVGVITKSALITRDIDVLAALSKVASVTVFVSIPFADDKMGRLIEPAAAPIHRRFEALRALSDAGIETGVAVAPLIAGLNDRDIAEVLERAAQAGAKRAFRVALRLPLEVLPVFTERLKEALPLAAERVLSQIRQVRGGAMNVSEFGARMTGAGARWQVMDDLFELTAKKVGLATGRNTGHEEEPKKTFERPKRQLALF
jgi:DNA repair photolyase